MIVSMTGYGRGEVSKDGVTAHVEVRSVNSRHLETVVRLARSIAHRETDIKEIVRTSVARGKLSVNVTLHKETNETIPLTVNTSAAKSYYKLLNQLRKAVKIREEVKLQHLLQFSEVLEAVDGESSDEAEWACV
ncbi:MAG: YicC family protein, partial [Proteobacteria bacterium]|nr:YicC family protein [Pseudomonadota bacterium]